MKRLFDTVASAAGLVLSSPILAVLAVAVRASSRGPAIYRSQRLGRGGQPFEMLKFRVMDVGTPDLRNPDGSTFNAAQDARVTSIGAWLRRTSLDELPQLWNVLRGDMSLVGPRPEDPASSTSLGITNAADRQRSSTFVPGITGLAQVCGRNSLTWKERRAIDLEVHRIAVAFARRPHPLENARRSHAQPQRIHHSRHRSRR